MLKVVLGLLLTSGLLWGCQPDPQEGEQIGPRPGIRALLTYADTVGAVVRLTTINGSPRAAENTIFFNQQPATAVAVRGDTLLVRVPVGATSGSLTLQVGEQRSSGQFLFTVLSGRWRRRADTPSARLWPMAVSGGNVAYWGMGDIQPPGFRFTQRDLWRYDPAVNRWERQADMPGPLRMNAVAFSLGSLVYVGLGRNASNSNLTLHDFYAFNPATNQWTPKASLPSPLADGFGVTFTLNGKAYRVGTRADRRTWEYDPQADTWTPKSDFPGTPRYDAVGFVLGTSGYVAGGAEDAQERESLLDSFWAYTPSTDTWARKAALPQPRRTLMAFVLGTKAYVGINFTQDVYAYDPAANTWTLTTRFPGAASYYTEGFSLNDKGYVVGGIREGSLSSELWEFTP